MEKEYNTNGFWCEKALIHDADFKEIISTLLKLINKRRSVSEPNESQWVEFAKQNPGIVTEIYDEMRDSECLLKLGQLPAITSIVKTIIPQPLLYKKIPFRIDVPFETKELAYWHQDDFYVKGNELEMTVWIPLYQTSMQNGCLAVMPGSHQLKKIPHSLQIGKKSVPEGIYNRSIQLVEMQKGDALFFSSYLIHSSTLNISDKVRYSIQLRYSSAEFASSKEMNGTIYV